MDNVDYIWINLPKYNQGYIKGIKAFIKNAFPELAVGDEMTCPYKNCKNIKWHRKDLVYDHLICSGPSPLYATWIVEKAQVPVPNYESSDDDMDLEDNINFGDNLDEMLHRTSGPNADAKKFYSHLEEGKLPLYPDLEELGIRKLLHPVKSSDGKYLEIRAAIFDMTNIEKDLFRSVLKNAKLPYGSASNISRFVHMKERKVSGYKSHDAHFVLHYLLQFAVKKSSKPMVAIPLIRLGAFLRAIWSKVIDLSEVHKLQQEIVEIICQFETIFTQAFFDIMVHLLIHLCRELAYVSTLVV
ncbi:hypothetical protein POM88_033690 [Heracleum sosnowskyi]|uniref:Transposase n=1 Tax=Heracleum sosnowskyi TaxID=360622 RepID=A0AAD8HIZ4_9APIA|nr:hypothetical protein POM88_033690 [Heracleum sosnowskyi]